VELEGLGVYCNPGEGSLPAGQAEQPGPAGAEASTAEWRRRMLEMIGQGRTPPPPAINHILSPVGATVRLTIDQQDGRGLVVGAPKPAYELTRPQPFTAPVLEARLEIGSLSLTLDFSAAQCFALLGTWVARTDHPPPPPRQSLPPMAAPRDWWRWACACVQRDAPPRARWEWATLRAACEERRLYAGTGELRAPPSKEWYERYGGTSVGERHGWYERQVGAGQHSWLSKLTDAEAEHLQRIEDERPVVVTQLWRRQALRRLDAAAKLVRAMCVHATIRLYPLVRARVHVFTCSRVHVFTCSRVHVFTCSRVHVFTCVFTPRYGFTPLQKHHHCV
jgi:hypothetical protein